MELDVVGACGAVQCVVGIQKRKREDRDGGTGNSTIAGETMNVYEALLPAKV